VQFGGDEIVQSKQGAGSATTCMAYAGFRFVKALIEAKNGKSVVEQAYIYLPGVAGGKDIAAKLGVDYFAVKVVLGSNGAAKAFDIGSLSENEQKLLEVAISELKVNIQSGQAFSTA
jgi:malate dehydrogenase